MIKLPFRIFANNLKDTYHNIRSAMNGNDAIIFDAMASITSGRRNPFIPPTSSSEFDQKHLEIEEILAYPVAGHGIDKAMRLMEEIIVKVIPLGGVGRCSLIDLLDIMKFQTGTKRITILLTDEFHWAVSWDIDVPVSSSDEHGRVFLDIYSKDWGEIVPSYLVRFVHCAMLAYQEKIYSVALSLLAITIEATLRDVLATRGYSFEHGAPSVDVFKFTKAEVGVSGNMYTLTFHEPLPLTPADFLSVHGSNSVEIEIRRNINPHKNRLDLLVRDPGDLIDHWSTNSIVQAARTKNVNGLGEALRIARHVEGFLTPRALPEDFDDVIRALRNNLIHLSGNALSTRLPAYDERSPSKPFTLQDFLEDDELVYDFITNVPRFISGQYNELRRAGHKFSLAYRQIVDS